MKAIIIATGREIKVYQHSERLTFIDESNCTDEYKRKELKFI